MTKRGANMRASASKRALKGVDVGAIDPLQVFREIAADRSAPAAARLAAAKAIIAQGGRKKADGDGSENDRISERALTLLRGGKR